LYLGQELQPLVLLQYQKPTFHTTNSYLFYVNLHLQTLGHPVVIFFMAIYKLFSQILCKVVLGPRSTTTVFASEPGNILLVLQKMYANDTWAEKNNLWFCFIIRNLLLLQRICTYFTVTFICKHNETTYIFFIPTYKVFGQILCKLVLGPRTTTSVFFSSASSTTEGCHHIISGFVLFRPSKGITINKFKFKFTKEHTSYSTKIVCKFLLEPWNTTSDHASVSETYFQYY
jgi:hypothetical protein